MGNGNKKLLITGFDPFGGETINPSWEAVRRLKAQGFVPKGDIILESVVEYGTGTNAAIEGYTVAGPKPLGLEMELAILLKSETRNEETLC